MHVKLNRLVATLEVCQQNTKFRHWNTIGVHFFGDHLQYDPTYEVLDDAKDEIAETVRQLNQFVNEGLDNPLFSRSKTLHDADFYEREMAEELQTICDYINKLAIDPDCDPITQNNLTEVGASIRERYFFHGSRAGVTKPFL